MWKSFLLFKINWGKYTYLNTIRGEGDKRYKMSGNELINTNFSIKWLSLGKSHGYSTGSCPTSMANIICLHYIFFITFCSLSALFYCTWYQCDVGCKVPNHITSDITHTCGAVEHSPSIFMGTWWKYPKHSNDIVISHRMHVMTLSEGTKILFFFSVLRESLGWSGWIPNCHCKDSILINPCFPSTRHRQLLLLYSNLLLLLFGYCLII